MQRSLTFLCLLYMYVQSQVPAGHLGSGHITGSRWTTRLKKRKGTHKKDIIPKHPDRLYCWIEELLSRCPVFVCHITQTASRGVIQTRSLLRTKSNHCSLTTSPTQGSALCYYPEMPRLYRTQNKQSNRICPTSAQAHFFFLCACIMH